MIQSIDIIIHNQIAEIDRAFDSIAQFSRKNNVPDKIIFILHLILDELLTNIISYGYSDDSSHQINVHYALKEGQFTLEIEDDSNPFDPTSAPKPDTETTLEDRKIGGLGIHLVKNMVDSIRYYSAEGKNHLVIEKKFLT